MQQWLGSLPPAGHNFQQLRVPPNRADRAVHNHIASDPKQGGHVPSP